MTTRTNPQPTPPAVDIALQERIHPLWDELSTFEAAKSEERDVAVDNPTTRWSPSPLRWMRAIMSA